MTLLRRPNHSLTLEATSQPPCRRLLLWCHLLHRRLPLTSSSSKGDIWDFGTLRLFWNPNGGCLVDGWKDEGKRVGHHRRCHLLWWLSANVRYLLLCSRCVVWTIWEKGFGDHTLECKEMSILCFVLDFTVFNWYCIVGIQFLQIFSMDCWYWGW